MRIFVRISVPCKVFLLNSTLFSLCNVANIFSHVTSIIFRFYFSSRHIPPDELDAKHRRETFNWYQEANFEALRTSFNILTFFSFLFLGWCVFHLLRITRVLLISLSPMGPECEKRTLSQSDFKLLVDLKKEETKKSKSRITWIFRSSASVCLFASLFVIVCVCLCVCLKWCVCLTWFHSLIHSLFSWYIFCFFFYFYLFISILVSFFRSF